MQTIPRPTCAAWRQRSLGLTAFIAAALLMWHGPIVQWAGYHHFADTRAWLGVPNACDVLSNLPFAPAGLWALSKGLRSQVASSLAWRAFAVSVIATAFGSSIYHLAPDNASLALDRLPIAWACASLMCAFLAERVDERWGRMSSVGGALVLATASVAWWALGDRLGVGDLRPYLFVQFLPMLIVPVALLMKIGGEQRGVPDRTWWTVLALYAAAKVMELGDHSVFDSIGALSGHTLKHLLAGTAAFCLLRSAFDSSQSQLR